MESDSIKVMCGCGRLLGRFQAYGDVTIHWVNGVMATNSGIYMECPKCRGTVQLSVTDLVRASEAGESKITAAAAEMT